MIFEKIMQVELEQVSVMETDRHIPRKLQATRARALFKQLGLKGISVTVPRYSMASSVYVQLPRENETWPERIAAMHKLGQILDRAFPSHDDRSDVMTDYFDFCWCIR